MAIAPASPTGSARPSAAGAALLRWSVRALVAVTWLSAAAFGIYTIGFYGGAVPQGVLEQWNRTLPRLYEAHAPLATTGIGLHFLTGSLLLVLGPIQFVAAIRARAPAVHRWIGRVYVTAALVTGIGGLAYIALKGTVGGGPMNLGFGLYGVLVVIAAAQAFRHARARRFELHRAWAIRLFALAVGSWLYRMDYGFWSLLTDNAGESDNYTGPFDVVMAFLFYLPNLAVAELVIRGIGPGSSLAWRIGAAAGLTAATALILLGTYYFSAYYWLPGLAMRFAARG
ncbi:MAG TPA: DUF2306 domain-containing protein [Stellaceae bacterium]|nr:DUF2306 domain-containing protein [Stellaceae bacterium]